MACLLGVAMLGACGCAREMSRGSAALLYSIADPLEVRRSDIGKNIQLKLDQKVLFCMAKGDEDAGVERGRWELADFDKRTLLLLSEYPRVEAGCWGLLLQARSLGSGEVVLKFIPDDESKTPKEVKFEISIRK
ncbi:MAG: hypothetical protein PHV34_04720 [Verrucomicrobiae bacterium]|nr:hypothetical protein [Verrucomicrobiae bacterium]